MIRDPLPDRNVCMAIDKIIHLTRHGQVSEVLLAYTIDRLILMSVKAEHNVERDHSILDPPLTQLGITQALELARVTRDTIQVQAGLLVTSPLTRTLQTTLLGYPHLKDRLESQSDRKSVIALPERQEVGNHPWSTGRDRWELEKVPDFKDVDFTSLGDDWNNKEGFFAPGNVLQRARHVRKWLRNRPEENIVGKLEAWNDTGEQARMKTFIQWYHTLSFYWH